jgi:Na+/H+ antiporter NhaD/arsenite permease-like protein
MDIVLILAFVIGYILIATEHPLRLDKSATALLTGVICWVILVTAFPAMPAFTMHGAGEEQTGYLADALAGDLSSIAAILFFLLGAMTIVEIMDAHGAFRVITERIKATNSVKLLWILSWITFFLSAGLDNLTTAIIMCALLRKLIPAQDQRWLFGGFVIIAANAGGAWSPIGDITTIMLWIGGQVTTGNIIIATFPASVVCLLIPLLIASVKLRRETISIHSLDDVGSHHHGHEVSPVQQRYIFFLGIGSLLSVPLFKSLTQLPPFMGVLLAVGVMWYVTEFMHRGKETDVRRAFSVTQILHRIDTPTILFFLGILLAVSSLEVSGHLEMLADYLDHQFNSIYVVNTLIGILSAIVDNVPLVAACMGMYDLNTFPPDHDFWELLAFCAGTGGSMLIIGSAAGVATMGILKIDFLWYVKRISLYALAGYIAGIAVYYVQHELL